MNAQRLGDQALSLSLLFVESMDAAVANCTTGGARTACITTAPGLLSLAHSLNAHVCCRRWRPRALSAAIVIRQKPAQHQPRSSPSLLCNQVVCRGRQPGGIAEGAPEATRDCLERHASFEKGCRKIRDERDDDVLAPEGGRAYKVRNNTMLSPTSHVAILPRLVCRWE